MAITTMNDENSGAETVNQNQIDEMLADVIEMLLDTTNDEDDFRENPIVSNVEPIAGTSSAITSNEHRAH